MSLVTFFNHHVRMVVFFCYYLVRISITMLILCCTFAKL